MDRKFKVGDKVRIVRLIKGNPRFESYIGCVYPVISVSSDSCELPIEYGTMWMNDELELVEDTEAIKPPCFALQYELDTDPVEFFAELSEVKARIRELVERRDLKRDSLMLYHIAKVEKIELSTAISFKSMGQPEKPKTRPYRKHHDRIPCPDCGVAYLAGTGMSAHRRAKHGLIAND